jgi:hypothetical protein
MGARIPPFKGARGIRIQNDIAKDQSSLALSKDTKSKTRTPCSIYLNLQNTNMNRLIQNINYDSKIKEHQRSAHQLPGASLFFLN